MDIFSFNNKALEYVKNYPTITLGKLLEIMQLGKWFRVYYILPMGGAIWSCSLDRMLDFPAATFVHFFHNHGLLSLRNRPQWYTLTNKSIDYVETLEKLLQPNCNIIKNAAIKSITRANDGVSIQCAGATSTKSHFDEVIFACHPTEILPLLQDITIVEKTALAKFTRQKNTAYTHKDISLMPKLKKCWSSWNYLLHKNASTAQVSVTYWMNKLQNLKTKEPLFVTLNPIQPIEDDLVYDVYDFYHPVFDQDALLGQKEIERLQGQNRIWFCGAYLKYGFHEDGIWSALTMIQKMGLKAPW
jgi:predicted NAD/FAD-binding protein